MLVFPCMRKIDTLLIRAILPPFLLALIVLTFVVFIQQLGRLSELLVTRNAAPDTIAIIAGSMLPGILIFSLPLSFLIGILIGLSGLSGESQIIALRACGVPLRSLFRPILFMGLMVGLLTGFLAIKVLPETTDVFYSLKDRINLRQAISQIQPRVFVEGFPNLVFYLDDLAADRQRWSRVFLLDNTDPRSPRTILAREGSWVTDSEANRLQLHLEQGTIYEVDPDNPGKDKLSIFATTDIPIELLKNQPNGNGKVFDAARQRKAFEYKTLDLWRGIDGATREEALEQQIELHRRIAIPFSVLGFSLLGLTLGVSTQKGGRTSGFVISLLLVIFFYVLFSNGLGLARIGRIAPWLGAWGANLILTSLGLLLLTRAERCSRSGPGFPLWNWKFKLEPVARQLHLESAQTRMHKIDEAIETSTGKIGRLNFPKILDLHVARGFLVYFLWSVTCCFSLFVVLTLFDLLDDIIRNGIPLNYVVNYFFFLVPYILMLVVPMAVLLAILINFGIMEKASEVTAMKAGGWSLYRISLPVFLLSGTICVSLYFIQDYILPYANIRQDGIRNVIKGKPAQTSLRPQRKWIFGESNRVFNYGYFDAAENLFIELNVFEIDMHSLKLLRRMHSERAKVTEEGKWILENGWLRDFRSGQEGFKKFNRREIEFPERPGYFRKEIFEPKESAKLTYLELKEYIKYLNKAGYNATELQVELYKKISLPISCLVMAMLGIPFSFSMGKKGAFAGIALSITIAISYWGVFSIFEKMGAYGFLIPLLAAWAPNLIFGAAGLALLFTIRT